MSSLLTNTAAISALQTLSMTQRDLTTTQNRISSGLKVANASDNAAYWSIATTMKSDNNALGAVKNSLNLGSSTVGVASSALNSTIDVVKQLQSDLVSAKQPGADRAKIQTDITALQSQLASTSASASFNGENWLSVDSSLSGYNATKSIVASFSRNSTGAINVGTIDIDTSQTALFDAGVTTAYKTKVANVTSTLATYAASGLAADKTAFDTAVTALADSTVSSNASAYESAVTAGTGVAAAKATLDSSISSLKSGGILDKLDGTTGKSVTNLNVSALTDSTADQSTLTAMINQVDTALKSITSSASTLGATKTRIDLQTTFISNLSDAITTGVGSLVDADMNEESTRLQALQTQQQLGIQSLSIANQNSQLILKLFQ